VPSLTAISQADTPDAAKLTKDVMTAWATFAKEPKDGLTKLGWPVYDPVKESLIVLGGRNDPKIKFVNRKTFDKEC
jgi:cholinesterase